jgi:hypothetical protein
VSLKVLGIDIGSWLSLWKGNEVLFWYDELLISWCFYDDVRMWWSFEDCNGLIIDKDDYFQIWVSWKLILLLVSLCRIISPALEFIASFFTSWVYLSLKVFHIFFLTLLWVDLVFKWKHFTLWLPLIRNSI